MSEEVDHDSWWASLPTHRKAQIRKWLSKRDELVLDVPGQIPLIDVEQEGPRRGDSV